MSNLPDSPLSRPGTITADFLAFGATDFRAACRLVQELPYRRTKRAGDYRAVLTEGCGTCSTKHALLAALAREQGLPVRLMLGVFEMTETNTPAAGAALAAAGLHAVPEAHCYLEVDGRRFDLTTDRDAPPDLDILHEEVIAPRQVVDYKRARHRDFVAAWLARHQSEGLYADISVDDVWQVRESCIAALSTATP